MTQPFFSVLVPVYNVKKYLDECVESLMGQSFPDYEVVLVDDGSTDGSGEMCDAWQARFPERIQVVHQENRGLIMARLTGFRTGRGRYFVNVDSDDALRSDALRILQEYIVRNDADLVFYYASVKPDFSATARKLPFRDGEVMSIASHGELRRILSTTFQMNSVCTKVFRRELAEIERDYSPVRHISEGEDLMFSLPLMDRAERIVFCDHVLYYYRTNLASISNTFKPALFRSMRDTLRIQRSYAEKWDPTGELARKCDANGLINFYNVAVKITRSSYPMKKKREYLLEMVTDPDFLRDYSYIDQMKKRKVKYALVLAKNKCFVPLYLFGALKQRQASVADNP